MSENEILDETLVARFKKGDWSAFDALMDRYEDRIYRVVYYLVENHEDAADLTQETFLKAFRNLDRFREESSFYTWLYRIARNTVISFQRKAHPTETALDQETENGEHRVIQIATGEPEPLERMKASEEQELVRRAIDELDRDHREVLILRELEGLSYEEIADLTGCAIGTVKSRIHRARAHLRKVLAPKLGLGKTPVP